MPNMLSIFSTFKPMAFIENLHYMGTGMLGIFIVIGVIIGITMILNKATEPGNKNQQ